MPQPTSLPTEVRRRVQAAIRTRNLIRALRSSTGAIDLASIMVGVLVIAVIAGVIAATVFAVIPWSQNEAAKGNLGAVRTAESVAQVKDGRFLDVDGLIAAGWLSADAKASAMQWSGDKASVSTASYSAQNTASEVTAPQQEKIRIVTDAAGSCYVAAARSDSSNVYYMASDNPEIHLASSTSNLTALGCVSSAAVQDLIVSLGGIGGATGGDSTGGVLVSAVEAGTGDFNLALDPNGNILSWGADGQGQLGNGNGTNPTMVPTQVTSGHRFVQIRAGTCHSLALDSDNVLWSWGCNSDGQLGLGGTAPVSVPTKVPTAVRFLTIAAAIGSSFAIDTDNRLWSWGSDGGYDGENILGNGPGYASVYTPTMITPARQYSQISATWRHAMALDMTGHLYTWGWENDGVLGNGVTVTDGTSAGRKHVDTPVMITPSATYTRVSALVSTSQALDSAGRLWAWGAGSPDTLYPLLKEPATKYVQLTGALNTGFGVGSANMSLDEAGRMWFNSWASSASTLPYPDVVFAGLSGGNGRVLAIDVNGYLWSWGYNSIGQLGYGFATGQVVNAATGETWPAVVTPTKVTLPAR